MFVTGHIAASLLVSRRWSLKVRWVVAAGLFPDVVDKTCRHVLHLVPTGRLPSHTLLGLGLTTAAGYLLGRRRGCAGPWVLAWVVGYALHLACDVATLVPLLWPFFSYDWPAYNPMYNFWRPQRPIEIASLVLEGVLVALALWVEIRRYWRARTPIAPQY